MPKGLQKIHVSFEDSTLTHYGGMLLFQQFCRKLDLKRLFQRYIPWRRRTSSYQGAELLLCLIYSMVAGLKRISDTRILAYNRSFQRLLGLTRFPSDTTLRDFLRGLHPAELKGLIRLHDLLRQKMRSLPHPSTRFVLDLDSTVLPLYGWTIQGARVGYNPHKPRRPSYHPLVCFEGRTQDSVHGLLRPGNYHAGVAAARFFRICRRKLPVYTHRKKVSVRLRADAGFFNGSFIRLLDGANTGYVVVAKLTPPLKALATRLTFRTFRQHGAWQVAEHVYHPMNWDWAHRFILIRRPKPTKDESSSQLTLWQFKDFYYHGFVSNLTLQPEAVYRFYNARALIELDLRELKDSLPLGKIPTTRFTANAAHFELILLAYDLVNWFRRLCLSGPWKKARLHTLRREVFMLPARLLKTHHRNVLKLPAQYPHRARFQKALNQIQRLRIS
jgi:hypothetical protein